MKWLHTTLATAALLLAGAIDAAAQGDRFVGVRKDASDEVILFSIETASGAERKIATLQKADAGVQLLGITSLNARRGTFSYAYTDRAAGKEYLHIVNVSNGQTVARIPLPADTSGVEVLADSGGVLAKAEAQTDALRRRIEQLEQEVRRLQSQVRPR
jgi:hypothetical protein